MIGDIPDKNAAEKIKKLLLLNKCGVCNAIPKIENNIVHIGHGESADLYVVRCGCGLTGESYGAPYEGSELECKVKATNFWNKCFPVDDYSIRTDNVNMKNVKMRQSVAEFGKMLDELMNVDDVQKPLSTDDFKDMTIEMTKDFERFLVDVKNNHFDGIAVHSGIMGVALCRMWNKAITEMEKKL